MNIKMRLIITFCLVLLGDSKDLGMQLDVFADDQIRGFHINIEEWNPIFTSGYPSYYQYVFKGPVGATIRVHLFNYGYGFFMGAMLTIGAKQLTTNDASQWTVCESGATSLTSQFSYPINGIYVSPIGNLDRKFDYRYIDYSFVIPDQLYCTNLDVDAMVAPVYTKQLATYYFQKDIPNVLNLSDLIHVPSTKTARVTMSNPLSNALLESGGSPVQINIEYDVIQPFKITGITYGIDSINYFVKTVDDTEVAHGCKVDIVICHQLCVKCDQTKPTNENNHQCITCIPGYELAYPTTPPGICKLIGPDNWYVDANNKIHYVPHCPIDYPLEITDTLECISRCLPPSDIYYQGKCIATCPAGLNEYKKKCYDKCLPVPMPNDDSWMYLPYTAEECIETINEMILYYLSLGKNIEGKDFLLQVYASDQPLTSNKPISSIDLTQCPTQLKLPPSEKLIIAKYDLINKDSAINQVEYNIYDKTGKILDLALCQSTQVMINYSIKDNYIDLNLLQHLQELGINSYNEQDTVYNDQCYSFHYKSLKYNDEANVVLFDRRIYFISTIPICESDCLYINITHSKKLSNCLCSIKSSLSTRLDPNAVISPSFTYLLPTTNFGIVKCFHLLLLFDNLKASMGFWLHIVLFFFLIICFVKYSIRGFKVIFAPLEEFNKHIIKKKRKTRNYIIESEKNQKLHRNQNVVEFTTGTNKPNSNEVLMSKELIHNDNKTVLCLFNDIISNYIAMVRFFKPVSRIEIRSLYTSYLLLHISLISAFNALLCQDRLISTNFTSSFPYGYLALNALICSVASWVITRPLRYLIFYHHLLEKEALTEKSALEVYSKYKQIIRKSTLMIAAFIHLSIILEASSWYYVTLFCVIYQKTQVVLVYSITMTIGFSLALFIIMSLICAVIKSTSLKCQSPRCYSLYLQLSDYFL